MEGTPIKYLVIGKSYYDVEPKGRNVEEVLILRKFDPDGQPAFEYNGTYYDKSPDGLVRFVDPNNVFFEFENPT